jgi:hypothetical protein
LNPQPAEGRCIVYHYHYHYLLPFTHPNSTPPRVPPRVPPTNNNNMSQLAAVPKPIGIFPQFFAAGLETLVLKEKVLSWTGDDFHIKLANGTPILRVGGKVMSISGRKKVYDMQGNHLFDIVKEHFHLHTTFAVQDAREQKIMEVKSAIQCRFDRRRVQHGGQMLTN